MDAPSLLAAIAARVSDAGLEPGQATDQPTIVVLADRLIEVCCALRDAPDLGFAFLADVTAVDWWPREPRFEVVYHLASIERRLRLRLKVRVPGERPLLPTVSHLWASANWQEREVWDLFGIVFDGHPDLRRLIMPEDWEGHPLRKDYPVQIRKAVQSVEPLQLTEAEFRANVQADRAARGRRQE